MEISKGKNISHFAKFMVEPTDAVPSSAVESNPSQCRGKARRSRMSSRTLSTRSSKTLKSTERTVRLSSATTNSPSQRLDVSTPDEELDAHAGYNMDTNRHNLVPGELQAASKQSTSGWSTMGVLTAQIKDSSSSSITGDRTLDARPSQR